MTAFLVAVAVGCFAFWLGFTLGEFLVGQRQQKVIDKLTQYNANLLDGMEKQVTSNLALQDQLDAAQAQLDRRADG